MCGNINISLNRWGEWLLMLHIHSCINMNRIILIRFYTSSMMQAGNTKLFCATEKRPKEEFSFYYSYLFLEDKEHDLDMRFSWSQYFSRNSIPYNGTIRAMSNLMLPSKTAHFALCGKNTHYVQTFGNFDTVLGFCFRM